MMLHELPYPAAVAGHICLDIIPVIHREQWTMLNRITPGKLVEIGHAVLATGGAVANTGLALHRLGVPTRLMGKIGDDRFGEAILSIIREQDASFALTEGMIVSPGEASSYSIVLSAPHTDRMFLHCTGANDTFVAEDVTDAALSEAGLLHLGYPPLMRKMYEHGGRELTMLMKRAKEAGVTTSLDLAKPEPDSDAGQADWVDILQQVLPYTDLFLPSIEEIMYMLRREQFEQYQAKNDLVSYMNPQLLKELSEQLLAMGAAVVVLKLGPFGLYMRTTCDEERLAEAGRYSPLELSAWAGKELYIPCFQVEVAGTTGAGDCTIAGFLAGWMQQLSPEKTLICAVGTGACNVEQPDALTGIQPWESICARIAAGWKQYDTGMHLEGFEARMHEHAIVWHRTR
ncbi:carbohydrate kinase family protein [Paenibacillus sp. GCM10023252]|uniref:carbohydrate kinase family protein n=1 Tax=Paenibacillus sp. GCM10023252 TaxID=3252649 RepID=UPI003617F751